MNADLFATIRGFKLSSRKTRLTDDDVVDRANHYYTPLIICIFAMVLCAKQYIIGNPIQCWIPQEFSGSWEQYAENYCWVKNTYFVPQKAKIPTDVAERREKELSYYQWVPFFLAFQALCFYVPFLIWKMLNNKSGVNLKTLVSIASNQKLTLESKQKREETLELLARHIEYSIVKMKAQHHGLVIRLKRLFYRIFLCGYAKTGNYLTGLFIFVKILYIVNIIGQFFLTGAFLNTNFFKFGHNFTQQTVNEDSWKSTGYFPRVTMCDFEIRMVGQQRDHTIECVLVTNLFNEKIFIFLWFWFLIVGIMTIVNTLHWIIWCCFLSDSSVTKYIPKPKSNVVHKRDKPILSIKTTSSGSNASGGVDIEDTENEKLMVKYDNQDEDGINYENPRSVTSLEPKSYEKFKSNAEFVNYLRIDGALVLRLISMNAGDPIVRDLVGELWKRFQ